MFLVLNVNGTKTLMGFIRTCEFLSNPKAKITEFGDQQASKFCVRKKYFFIRCTRATNLRGLGTRARMLGRPKGSPKFSLEHSLVNL